MRAGFTSKLLPTLPLRVYLCFNKLCFVLKPKAVVCKLLLAMARTEIAGLGLPLTSWVEAFCLTQACQPGITTIVFMEKNSAYQRLIFILFHVLIATCFILLREIKRLLKELHLEYYDLFFFLSMGY